MKIISRAEAKQLGLKKYFSGEKCTKGHLSERYTSKGSCIECLNDYRLQNPEKFKVNQAKSRAKNQEKNNQYRRLYYKNNKEKCFNAVKSWGQRNKYLLQFYVRKRQAAKLNRTPSWLSNADMFEIECIYKYCASLRSIGLNYVVDHIIPLQGQIVSGLHVPSNLQIMHASENSTKGNRYEI